MTPDIKPLLASRTIWANIIGLIAFTLTAAGIAPDALGDQGKLVDAILQLVTAASFLASTAFRVGARQRIG